MADLAEGTRAVVDFTVSAEDMKNFAALSGDHNPLHCDNAFAQRKGFKSGVVYGALIVAKISELIGMKLPGRDAVWSSLNLQFHHPLYVGEAAQVEGIVARFSAATGMALIKLIVTSNGKTLVKGEAETLVKPG